AFVFDAANPFALDGSFPLSQVDPASVACGQEALAVDDLDLFHAAAAAVELVGEIAVPGLLLVDAADSLDRPPAPPHIGLIFHLDALEGVPVPKGRSRPGEQQETRGDQQGPGRPAPDPFDPALPEPRRPGANRLVA